MRQEDTLEYKIHRSITRFVQQKFERTAVGEKEGLMIQVRARYHGWAYWNKYVLNVKIQKIGHDYDMERWSHSFHSYASAEKQFQSLVSKYNLSVKPD